MPEIDTYQAAPDRQPYPLLKRFSLFVLPGLILCMALLVSMTIVSARQLITDEYLKIAQRQTQAMVASIKRAYPAMWVKLTDGTARQQRDWESAEWKKFADYMDVMASDRALPKLKMYDARGFVLYSSDRSEIGDQEKAYGIDQALKMQKANAVSSSLGTDLIYELYIYFAAEKNQSAFVVELYEPETRLATLISSSVLSLLFLPLALFALILVLLTLLVRGAQADINERTSLALELQERLQKFMSRRAANAARAAKTGLNEGRSIQAALYFADVRNFTSYAEKHSPSDAVTLLNELIEIQVKQIHRFGGDVDKIIGDAVLAVFTGERMADRAIGCAVAVLSTCHLRQDLARSLGIGVHVGQVISGSIGTAQRQDHTVIGDAVNVVARLSANAAENELVIDSATVAVTDLSDCFSLPEEVQLKGKSGITSLRRWRVRSANV
jgi:class 3 adenylate cyclase